MAAVWNPQEVRPGIIVVSDRILAGQRPNTAAELCAERLLAEGLADPAVTVVGESRAAIETAIARALEEGRRLILVLGGSGFRAGNDSPEAARSFIERSPRTRRAASFPTVRIPTSDRGPRTRRAAPRCREASA